MSIARRTDKAGNGLICSHTDNSGDKLYDFKKQSKQVHILYITIYVTP